MAIARQVDGSWVVDAAVIAPAFRIDAADVPALMRDGLITSRHEEGQGQDSGRSRITFFYGRRALRLTIDDNGKILSQASFDVAPHSH